MARVNAFGYVERRTGSPGYRYHSTKAPWRNWWLVKCTGSAKNTYCGGITVKTIVFPQSMVGKRIRLKVEVIEDGIQSNQN